MTVRQLLALITWLALCALVPSPAIAAPAGQLDNTAPSEAHSYDPPGAPTTTSVTDVPDVEHRGADALGASTSSSGLILAAKAGTEFVGDTTRIAELTADAAKLYPKLAGKHHLHHVTPKYLGGAADGRLVKVDAAYHQLITNEFRRLAPYEQPRPSPARLQEIMKQVYSKYPLPG